MGSLRAVRLFETRNQLPNNYVMKVDKASMSVSVEARVPFLDQSVAEIAYRIPKNLSLPKGRRKKCCGAWPPFPVAAGGDTRSPKFGGSIAASWLDDQPAFRSYAKDIILARVAGPKLWACGQR